MNKLNVVNVLLWLLLAQQATAAESIGDLTVEVTGLGGNEGQVVANLFGESNDVMKIEQAYKQEKSAITGHHASLVFRQVPYGKYAVSVFHDQNANGKLDHNLLHLPAEPLGFSNHFSMGVFSGLPSFEKLQFVFEAGKEKVEIELR